MQTARTEAIKRNAPAQFIMTNTPVSVANLANVVAPTPAGANWVVRATGAGGVMDLIEAKSGLESEAAAGGVPAIQVVGAAAAPAVFGGTIPFNGFGGTTTNAAYSINISNPTAGVCAEFGGAIRCRRILVSPGGEIRACDPVAPAGDSRACV